MIYIVIQTSQRQTFYSVCNVHTVKCWMQTQIPIPRAIDRYGQSTADRRPRSNEDDAKQVGGSRNGRSGGRRHRKDAPKRNYTASVACFLQSRIDTSPAEIDTCTSFSFCSELLVYPRERAHTHTHTHTTWNVDLLDDMFIVTVVTGQDSAVEAQIGGLVTEVPWLGPGAEPRRGSGSKVNGVFRRGLVGVIPPWLDRRKICHRVI